MTKRKNTFRALLVSALSLLLCVSMLVGSTLAWFTDTATTSVNSIQSGTLDVVLEMATAWDDSGNPTQWEKAEGKTLSFRKAAGAPDGEKLLWEPGCTYKLPELRFSNNGNLKLKYQLVITGIQGDAKLNKAINWTITHNGATTSLVNEDGTPVEFSMEPQAVVGLTISGTMDPQAGNEYQGLTIDGISITIYATQLGGSLNGANGEYDSNGNTYDENADYPMHFEPTLKDAAMTKTEDGYTYTNSAGTVTANTAAAVNNDAAVPGVQLEKVDTTNTGSVSVTSNQDSFAYDIKISNLKVNTEGKILDANNTVTTATITFTSSKNLDGVKLYHDGVAMTAAASAADVNAANEFFYDASTGVFTICVDHFSNFTAVYDLPVAFNQNNTLYTSVQAAINDTDSATVSLSADVSESIIVNKTLTLDLKGHTVNMGAVANACAILAQDSANLVITGNGTVNGGSGGDNVAVRAESGAVVTIQNGTFTVGGDANGNGNTTIYSTGGTINIQGGHFSSEKSWQERYYVLNLQNGSNGAISVSGGTFVKFNPAGGDDYDQPTNFVAKNYEAKANGEDFVVVKSRIWEDDQGNKHITVDSMTALSEALSYTAQAESNHFFIDFAKGFDMTGWQVYSVAAGGKPITINGNGHTLTNLEQPLLVGTNGGNNTITINDLTIKNANISQNGYNNLGVGAFIAYLDGSGSIVMNNCHLQSSTIVGTGNTSATPEINGMAGGLIGYSSSQNVTFTNCSVTDSTITGLGNTGGLIGYSSAKSVVTGCTVSGNTIKCSEPRKTWRVGAIFGTFQGKAGSEITNCTYLNSNTYLHEDFQNQYDGNEANNVNEAYGRGYNSSNLTITGSK